ncbi:MAG: carboxypeptidase-like regulatory domain-containing protein [Cryomorphaceae bacterium]
MRLIPLIVIVVALFFTTCRKPKVYEIRGSVTEFYSASGVEGAEVEVAYSPISYGSVSGGYETLVTAKTGERGGYYLSFDFVSTATFRIRVRHEGYLLAEEIVNADQWSTKEDNVMDVIMYKAAELRFRLINTAQSDGQLLLNFSENSVGCDDCCDYQQGRLFEGYFDTTISCPVYGNQLIQYKLTRIYPGSAVPEAHSIFVDKGLYQLEHHF